jgi:hypothetical protein
MSFIPRIERIISATLNLYPLSGLLFLDFGTVDFECANEFASLIHQLMLHFLLFG